MLDCNWLSDGILVLCADSKISYFSWSSWRTYLLVSILYSHDSDSGSGFGSSNVFGRKGGRENDQKDYNFADRCSDIDRKCFYKWFASAGISFFPNSPHFRIKITAMVLFLWYTRRWILICLTGMEIILIRKSRIPGKKQFWLPVIPGILLLGWNIGNILRLPFIKIIAGDMTAVCLSF